MINDNMRSKLRQLARRLEEIDGMLADPACASDMSKFRALTKERADIEPVVKKHLELESVDMDISTAQGMLEDPEMKAFAQEEILEAQKKLEVIEHELQILLLPKDPNDSRNIFLEIRAGTGGDESALFAGDLLRMYLRYAEDHRWQTEIVSKNDSELGGYKEVIVRIIGEGAYSKLKFESGGHRVQRVPATESQGRVHTSACTVAVLPELDEIGEVNLNPADLRIDVFRASAPAASTFRRRTQPSESPTCPRAWSSSVRTSEARPRTRRAPWPSLPPASMPPRWPSSRPRRRASARA